MRIMSTKKTANFTFRLQPELRERLERLAEHEGRSLGAMVHRLVDEALEARDRRQRRATGGRRS